MMNLRKKQYSLEKAAMLRESCHCDSANNTKAI